jgi:hypothetical protein
METRLQLLMKNGAMLAPVLGMRAQVASTDVAKLVDAVANLHDGSVPEGSLWPQDAEPERRRTLLAPTGQQAADNAKRAENG